MKIRSLIFAGLVAAAVFAVALLPASVAWRVVGSNLSLPVMVEKVGGTVWNGFLVGRFLDPAMAGPLVVRWNMKPLHLLAGELSLDLGLEGAQFRSQGVCYWGLWGKGVQDFNGEVQTALFGPMLSQFGISIDGSVKMDALAIKMSGTRINQAAGEISWQGGQVQVNDGGGLQMLDFPGVLGRLQQVEGDLAIKATETRENKPLGELTLMLEQGLAGIKVFKRVMVLAGYSDTGDDDRVLVNLQQPLPF